MKHTAVCAALLTAGLLSPASQADTAANPFGFWYLSEQDDGWYYEISAGVEREPTYTGSENYETEADLDFRAIYRDGPDRRYFLSLGEVGAIYDLDDDLLFAAVLEYEEARDNSEDSILGAFEDGDDTLEAQLTLARRWHHWSVAAVFQPDILDRGKGLVTFFGAAYDRRLSDRLRFHGGIDISFGDSEHLDTEVGVPDEVAANSELTAYSPSGGYKSTSVSLDLGYALRPDLELLFQSEIEFYGSEMADSPLVRDFGDDVNTELGVSFRYQF